ncbi:hypothetical protein [Bacillus sp. AK128]
MFSIVTGCSSDDDKGVELVISQFTDFGLIAYKDLKDPTAENPSYNIQLNDDTDIYINDSKGNIDDLKINQIILIKLEDGILDDSTETAVELNIVE